MSTSFTDHVHYEFLRPYFHLDFTSDSATRFRVELRNLPRSLLPFVRSITTPCVACNKPMSPLRSTGPAGRRIYFAATCPLQENVTCSRRPEARKEYQRIRESVQTFPRAPLWRIAV